VKLAPGKGRVISVQDWTGHEGSMKLSLPDFKTGNEGAKVVSPKTGLLCPTGNIPGTDFY